MKGYDYTRAGAYFVTVCTQDRICCFGRVCDGAILPSEAGRMVRAVWEQLPVFYQGVVTEAFVVMPNHIHGVITLVGAALGGRPGKIAVDVTIAGQARGPAPTTLGLSDVVHRFKTMTTKRYIDGVNGAGWPPFRGRLWQRNYFETVLRSEAALERVRNYVLANPAAWEDDEDNPAHPHHHPGRGGPPWPP